MKEQNINKFIIALPKIKLKGKNDKIMKKNLSLLSILEILFLK